VNSAVESAGTGVSCIDSTQAIEINNSPATLTNTLPLESCLSANLIVNSSTGSGSEVPEVPVAGSSRLTINGGINSTSEEEEESIPLIRIRTDMFDDDFDETAKENLKRLSNEVNFVKSELVSAFKKVQVARRRRDLPTELESTRELIGLMDSSLKALDDADTRMRGYELESFVPAASRYPGDECIEMDELVDYCVMLLALSVLVRYLSSLQEIKEAILMVNYQITRIVHFYSMGKKKNQSQFTFLNVIQKLSEKRLAMPMEELRKEMLKIWDRMTSWDAVAFNTTVVIVKQHKSIGVEGFAESVRSLIAKSQEIADSQRLGVYFMKLPPSPVTPRPNVIPQRITL
jgi:hypothetical protein